MGTTFEAGRKEERMLSTEQINMLLGVDDPYKAPAKLMETLFDRKKREEMFDAFLLHEYRIDYDWFHIYYQEEQAQRKQNKQDFTPDGVSKLISKIAASEAGSVLDSAAGTGGITIQKWNEDRLNALNARPFHYQPADYFYFCEELSDRAVPFLIFNLAIRGANAIVIHGDLLSRTAKQVYFVQNDENDFLKYSSINIMPHTAEAEKEFGIAKWLEPEKNYVESPNFFEKSERRTDFGKLD